MLLGLAQLWDGAIVLARWLQRQIAAGSGSDGCDRTVLELGAGTGLVGISAAVLCGARVLLTDRDAVFTVTQLNAERNRGGVAAAGGVLRCAELDWLVAAPPDDDGMVWGRSWAPVQTSAAEFGIVHGVDVHTYLPSWPHPEPAPTPSLISSNVQRRLPLLPHSETALA